MKITSRGIFTFSALFYLTQVTTDAHSHRRKRPIGLKKTNKHNFPRKALPHGHHLLDDELSSLRKALLKIVKERRHFSKIKPHGQTLFHDAQNHKKAVSSTKITKRRSLSTVVPANHVFNQDNSRQQTSQPQAALAQKSGNPGDSSTEFQGTGKYRQAGCFKDTETRAVPLLEGSDIQLTGFYKQRQDPIAKCASVAKSYGFQLFAIQNGGMCLSGANAHDTYKIHGLAKNCKDGKGGPWASDVYIFNDFPLKIHIFTGTLPKAGTDANVYLSISGSMGTSRRVELAPEGADQNPFEAGQKDVFNIDTIPLGSISGITIGHDNAGQATADWYIEKVIVKDAANNMYKFQVNRWLSKDEDDGAIERELSLTMTIKPGSYKSLGCFKERTDVNKERAIPSLEGRDEILDGQGPVSYRNREYAVEKCADASRRRGYVMFGIQDGGLCATSKEIQNTYDIYGESEDCYINGTGSTFSTTIYTFVDQEPGFKEAEETTQTASKDSSSLSSQPLPPSDPAMQLTGSSATKPETTSNEATQASVISKKEPTNINPQLTPNQVTPSKTSSETGAGRPEMSTKKPDVSTGTPNSSAMKPDVPTGTSDSSTGTLDSSVKKPDVPMNTPDSSAKKPDVPTGTSDSSTEKSESSGGSNPGVSTEINKPGATSSTNSVPESEIEKEKPSMVAGQTNTEPKNVPTPETEKTHPSREDGNIPSTPSDPSILGVSPLIKTPLSPKIRKIAPESRLPGEFTSLGRLRQSVFHKTSKETKRMPFNKLLLDRYQPNGNKSLFPGM